MSHWTFPSKLVDELRLRALQSLGSIFEGVVLDLGCGSKPYESMMGTGATKWFGLDRPKAAARDNADVIGDAVRLPFRSQSFDGVLCTEVLEHIPDPPALLREAKRVLKAGSPLILTTPQMNPLHEEPRDYFRFTNHGLRSLAETEGFTIDRIVPIGAVVAATIQLLLWHLGWLRSIPLIGSLAAGALTAALSWVALKLDGPVAGSYRGGALKTTLGWMLVARAS